MGPFDRGLLAVYALFITLLSSLFAAVLLGWAAPLFWLREYLYPDRADVLWTTIAGLILAGVRLFWVSLRRPEGKHVVLAESALGQVKVSLQAIESLVEKVVSQVSGVREVKPRIILVPQGVGIQVRVAVTPDVNVPEASLEIQNRVKERVLEVTGITINQVKVSVENIAAHKPRVE